MEDVDILQNFVGKNIKVKQHDDSFITGRLISIDGYLNIVLENVSVFEDEDATKTSKLIENMEILFVRGSYIEFITLE